MRIAFSSPAYVFYMPHCWEGPVFSLILGNVPAMIALKIFYMLLVRSSISIIYVFDVLTVSQRVFNFTHIMKNKKYLS